MLGQSAVIRSRRRRLAHWTAAARGAGPGDDREERRRAAREAPWARCARRWCRWRRCSRPTCRKPACCSRRGRETMKEMRRAAEQLRERWRTGRALGDEGRPPARRRCDRRRCTDGDRMIELAGAAHRHEEHARHRLHAVGRDRGAAAPVAGRPDGDPPREGLHRRRAPAADALSRRPRARAGPPFHALGSRVTPRVGASASSSRRMRTERLSSPAALPGDRARSHGRAAREARARRRCRASRRPARGHARR